MDKKKLIKIGMSAVCFLIGITLIYYIYETASVEEDTNKEVLIEKDTLFLCPGDEYN